MTHDKTSYSDLTAQELADEIAGLDKEVEEHQMAIARFRRYLRQAQGLRESLIEIYTRRTQVKGWH